MSLANTPSADLSLPGRRESKTDASRTARADKTGARSTPALLPFLYGATPQEWTNDHLMLNGDVKNLVASIPPSAHAERKHLIARITEIVEKRPSLFQTHGDTGEKSEDNGDDLRPEIAELFSGMEHARGQRIAGSLGVDSTERPVHGRSGFEENTQDNAQKGVFSSRLNALRRRVAVNHYNLSNGIATTPYEVPTAFLEAKAPRAEEYSLLAEVHYCQGQLSGELLAANGPKTTDIEEEVKGWDINDVEKYLERLTSFYQRVGGHSNDWCADTPQRRSVRKSTAMGLQTPEEAIRDKDSETPLLGGQHLGGNHAGEDHIQDLDSETKAIHCRNGRTIKALRGRLEKNNTRLATGGIEHARLFTGRPSDFSVGNRHLAATNRLKVAVDQQVQLSQRLAESEDPTFKANVVEFAQRWASKKWVAAVCNQYEKDLAKTFRKLMSPGTIDASHLASDTTDSRAALPGSASRTTSVHVGRVKKPQARGRTTGSKKTLSNISAATLEDVLAAGGSPTNVDVSQVGHSSSGNFREHVNSTPAAATGRNETSTALLSTLVTDTARSVATPSQYGSTPASGGTQSFGGDSSAKTIVVRLSLPENTKTAPRRLIWSQDLDRDGFFYKVGERFCSDSVHSVEVFIGDERILIEPRGGEDEWEILRDEMRDLLTQPSKKRLQVTGVVHVR